LNIFKIDIMIVYVIEKIFNSNMILNELDINLSSLHDYCCNVLLKLITKDNLKKISFSEDHENQTIHNMNNHKYRIFEFFKIFKQLKSLESLKIYKMGTNNWLKCLIEVLDSTTIKEL